MMRRYESLLLTVPEITQDEIKQLETSLNDAIKHVKGDVISFEKWGKYKLCYPVRNNDYGVYFLMRFEVEPGTSLVEDIRALFKVKLSNIVMREMSTLLDPKQTLAYQRPPSLEDTPTRDVTSFLKENKMEGLLKRADKKGPSEAADQKFTTKEDESKSQISTDQEVEKELKDKAETKEESAEEVK